MSAATLPSASSCTSSEPQDFWWKDVPPAKELPPPIVPEHWLVVQESTQKRGEPALARCLLDARGAGPRPEPGSWSELSSKRPAGVVAAYTRVASERDEVRMARLSGAKLLIVNGEGFVGDIDNRGFRGVPVALKKGNNDLYVFDIPDSFELELWCPETRSVLATWDVGWPGSTLDDDVTYPVFNASLAPVECLHVHYGHALVDGPDCTPQVTDWRDGGRILPLGLRIGASYYLDIFSDTACNPKSMDEATRVPICVYAGGDPAPDEKLLRWPGAKSAGTRAVAGRSPSALLGTALLRLDAHALLVYGSHESLARARFDQQSIWYRANYVPEAIDGAELLSLPPETKPDEIDWHIREADNVSRYVVYGNADTNPAWKHFVPDDYPIQVHEGRLSVNGKEFTGDDICGWFMLKTPDHEDVLAIADTGARGARLGYLVQPLLSDASDLEYAFWDARGSEGAPRLFGFANRVR
jgi:hypothetical protein